MANTLKGCLNIQRFLQLYGGYPTVIKDMLLYCVGSPEHPIYHPEGTLERHIDIVLERAFETDVKELHFSALLHDLANHGHLECIGYESRQGNLKEVLDLEDKKY